MNTMRHTKWRVFPAIAITTMLAMGSSSAALTLGQIDDFQDGSTQGWSANLMLSPPTNLTDGGPTGTGDHSLRAQVDPFLDTFSITNSTQWAGDYVAAGITTITLDINNLGPNALSLGILLNGASAGTNSVIIPAGSGWVSQSIDLTTLVFGSPATLNAVTSIDLVSMTAGTVVSVGELDVRVDNIQATPEPSSLLLGALALTAASFRRRRA